VAAGSLKVFALPVKVIAVGWGRQEAFWLLHDLATPALAFSA
jgi:hypothetical protein